MKMKKESMDDYAKRRRSEIKMTPPKVSMDIIRPMIMHDPEGDLHTLMRAAEVKADKKRHKAAKDTAAKKIGHMKAVVVE